MQTNQKTYKDLHTEKINRTLSFFRKNDIGFKLSRNEKALSCADAAQKRHRNLLVGIPLEDELKTFFGEVKINPNKTILVLLNLGGNNRIDFDKVRKLLNTDQKISFVNEKTMNLFGIEYGAVNPFLIHEKFHQIRNELEFDDLIIFFDLGLINRKRSMMTNAGELTWGIEFVIDEIIDQFKNVVYNKSFKEIPRKLN